MGLEEGERITPIGQVRIVLPTGIVGIRVLVRVRPRLDVY